MRRNLSLALLFAMLLGAVPLLTACHTMAGAGRDMSTAGHNLTDSAQQNMQR